MPFCQECGSEVDESQKFCGSCGVSLSPGVRHSKVSKKKPIIFGLVLIFVFVVVVVAMSSGDTQTGESTSQSDTSPTAITQPTAPVAAQVPGVATAKPSPDSGGPGQSSQSEVTQSAPVTAPPAPASTPSNNIGDTVNVGYWSYRVSGYKWVPYIIEMGEIQRPNAEFLVIEISCRNNDNSSSTLPPIELVDAAGDNFSSSAIMDDGFLDPLTTLNPHVSTSGLVAFDVPQGKYQVKLSGGYESGATALVNLETSTPSSVSAPGSGDSPQNSGQTSPSTTPPPVSSSPDE